jgi:threonine dehydrogenase-like Zn-dependent dehydrogenase
MQALQFSVSIPQWIVLKALGFASRKPFYKGPLATVKLVDCPEPELPTQQWVKVETLTCGFCASDLSLIFLKESPTASPFTSFPSVIGHEICGRIVCTGTAGGFAPRFIAHKSQVFKLPESCSPRQGALIEPLTVGLQAVYSNRPQSGEKVMIVGGGVIGTMILKAIRGLDIDCDITVVDPSVFAADLAKQAGADHVIASGNELKDTVRLTDASRYKPMMGPDILMGGFTRIYDSVGSSETLNMAMRCLAAGGTLSQVGIWHDVKLDLTPLWLKQQTLRGVYGCGYAEYQGKTSHMFEIALDMIDKGNVTLDGMVTHTFSLDSFDKMIEVNLAKEKHGAVKTAVSFI